MPYIIDAVKAYATVGEVCNTLKGVFGEYKEPATILKTKRIRVLLAKAGLDGHDRE